MSNNGVDKILKDLDPRILKSEEFDRLIDEIKEQQSILKSNASESDRKGLLIPYVSAPSILGCATWK